MSEVKGIIFTDFDGTLFNPETQEVIDGTWEAFKNAKERGYITCLVTGRPKPSFDRISSAEMIESFDYISTDNGAKFYKSIDGNLNLQYAELLPLEIVEEINEYALNNNISAVHNGLECSTKTCDTTIENNKFIWKDELPLGIQKEVTQINLDGNHPDVFPEWQQNWHPTMTSFAVEAGKSLAVEHVKSMYPDAPSCAFGDEWNDIKMFESVDLPIGMYHLTDDLLPYAHIILDEGYKVPEFINKLN